MKKNTIYTLFAMCFILVTNVAFAGGSIMPPSPVEALPADMAMIASTKALESYAKEAVAQATAYCGSEGAVLPGGRTYAQAWANDPDIRVIQKLLSQEVLSFKVLDPTKNIWFWAHLSDTAGNPLFWGSNTFQLQKDGDNWVVPKGATDIELELVDNVPISIPGVTMAFAVVKDPTTGNEQYVSIPVWNEYIFFPTSLAGITGGQLVIGVGNNSGAYDTTTGSVAPTTSVKSAVNASIKGLITLDDPGSIVSSPHSFNGEGQNPLYQVSVSANGNIDMSAETSEGEVAIGVYVRQVGASTLPVYFQMQAGAVTLHFVPGVWDVWFVYPNFGNDEPSIPPYYGGGMG